MNLLVLNCGGSTLKYKLFQMPAEKVLCSGLVDRLGTEKSVLKHRKTGSPEWVTAQPVPDHLAGIHLVFETLVHSQQGVLSNLSEISAIAHKLAHGGEKITGSVFITPEVIAAMETMVPLVPLHNPPNLKGIEVCQQLLPKVPQVGTFETSFHHTVPSYAWIYGLPYTWYEQDHIRSYGFHSCSHRYVIQRVAELLQRSPELLRLVSCHLGSGTSVCAIQHGRSLDISSGLTPQSGTIMSTRPGDFDPFAVTMLMKNRQLSLDQIEKILVKESGLLGISGVSGDMRDIEEAAASGNERAQLAVDAFCYQVRKYIGAYALLMGGIDVLSFTGGIGENSPLIRERICANLGFLGLSIDLDKNQSRGKEQLLSSPGSANMIAVILTDEEIIVARDAARLLGV